MKPREYSNNLRHFEYPMAYRVTQKLRQSCSNWRPPGDYEENTLYSSRKTSSKTKMVLQGVSKRRRRQNETAAPAASNKVLRLVSLVMLVVLSVYWTPCIPCAKAEEISKTGKKNVFNILSTII